MAKFDLKVREKLLTLRRQRPQCVHKKWVDFPTGLKALVTDLFTAAQLALLAVLYAFFAWYFPVFLYVSVALTVCAAVYVFVTEHDSQSKASWLFLFLISFGCGYIVYFLADKRICYGFNRKRYSQIFDRSRPYIGAYGLQPTSAAVSNDCEYIYKSGGYVPYTGTDIKYFSDARKLFDNLIGRLEQAQDFIFLEYFIVAEGVLLERLLDVLKRKAAQGVEVRFLCDDVGCQGVLTSSTKKRIKNAGIKFKIFEKLFSPFSFGLNFRDHRKIIVIDGKTGYVGGCNIADECTNQHRMEGLWKDAGVRLDGGAVDGLSLTFLRQWEFSTREKSDYERYLCKAETTENTSNVVPYAGGPEICEHLCRNVYVNMASAACEKLYIMTPYLIPDGELFTLIKTKAMSGVDVRIVLPAVPDYPFIYRVTRSNAEKLMAHGAKVYFVRGMFVHSKVMLTENCVTVGSVNLDMRAFYQEFDNGIYTDDKSVMADALDDFKKVFAANGESTCEKHNVFSRFITALLRIVSPLM